MSCGFTFFFAVARNFKENVSRVGNEYLRSLCPRVALPTAARDFGWVCAAPPDRSYIHTSCAVYLRTPLPSLTPIKPTPQLCSVKLSFTESWNFARASHCTKFSQNMFQHLHYIVGMFWCKVIISFIILLTVLTYI